MLDQIIHFSIKNKLIIGFLTIMLVAWGGYSLTQLPIDAVPDITNNQVQVITITPTLAAQEVERLITFPVEQSMATIPDIEEMRSISRFGLSVITVVFKDGVDVYWARQQVNERLGQVQKMIPAGIGTPEMAPVSTGLGEIYQYVIRPKKGYETKFDAMELRTIQDWIVRRQLLGTPGVADVSSFGGYVKQYEIAIDPNKIKSMDITMDQVFTALEKNNQNTGGAYIDKNPNVYYIRSEGLVGSIQDIEKIVVTNTAKGIPILISNIGVVQLGHSIRYGAMTRNTQGEVVGAIVLMLKGENSGKVIQLVKEKIEQISKTLPEGVVIEPFLDRTKLVNNAIHTVIKNLAEGALIVIFVLVLLLGNFRAGLVVASVIPLAMLFAIAMMNLFGVSGNLMSLGAIDFGLIVDGAVIIVEATLHHLHDRFSNKTGVLTQSEMDDEVYDSARKIRNSAAFGEIIILIVYLPILALVGVEGKMFKPMAQTVSFAILGAFILSLTYVPMISALMLSKKVVNKKNISDTIMDFFQRGYAPLIKLALNKRLIVISSAFILFALSILVFISMGGEFIPTLDEGDFAVETRLMPGSSISHTIEVTTKAAEIILKKFPEVKEVIGKIGTSEIPTDPMPMEACDLMIILKDKDEWVSASSREELADQMSEALSVIPGVNFGFQQPIQMRFNELMTGARQDVVIKVFGEDLDSLAKYGDKIGHEIQGIKGVEDIYVEQVTGLPQIVVKLNRDKIAQFGLSIDEVNKVIKTGFAGSSAGMVYEGEKRFDLVLRLNEENRKDIDNIKNVYVHANSGNQIPLSQIADIEYKVGPNQIQREDAKRRIIVGFNVRGRDVESIVTEIKQKLDKTIKFAPGYYPTYGGAFKNLIEARARLSIAVPVSLLMIFILLFLTFDSVKHSLLIFTAIPLSATGGIFALWLRGMPFSISAGVGFIALFGVAVLNGIVLISEFNRLKKEGMIDLKEIVVTGTKVRLRPVIMTAMVASMGFLPMALSNGSGAEVQKPLATVVIGGLISATLLTLIVLPVLYSLLENRSFNMKNKISTVSLVLFTFILFSCGAKKEVPSEPAVADAGEENKVELTTEQFKNAKIQLGKIDYKNISRTIKASGTLDVPPQSLVSISAPLGGFVKSIEVLQGSQVKKGQLIAVLEHPDYIQLQQDYLNSKIEMEFQTLDYAREKDMSENNISSLKTFQQTTVNYKSLQNKVNALEEKLKLIGINPAELKEGKIKRTVPVVSPIDGFVTIVNVNNGKYVAPTDVMIEIVNTQHLHAEITIFEKDINYVKKGQKIIFSLVNESKERKATVFLNSHSVSADKTVRIHGHLESFDPELLPGMYINALIETENNHVPAVPENAVINGGSGENFIFIKSKDTKANIFEIIKVKKIATENGFSEIELPSEIDINNTQVVINGAFDLYSKMKNMEEEE